MKRQPLILALVIAMLLVAGAALCPDIQASSTDAIAKNMDAETSQSADPPEMIFIRSVDDLESLITAYDAMSAEEFQTIIDSYGYDEYCPGCTKADFSYLITALQDAGYPVVTDGAATVYSLEYRPEYDYIRVTIQLEDVRYRLTYHVGENESDYSEYQLVGTRKLGDFDFELYQETSGENQLNLLGSCDLGDYYLSIRVDSLESVDQVDFSLIEWCIPKEVESALPIEPILLCVAGLVIVVATLVVVVLNRRKKDAVHTDNG